jgi:hypothetical protein
VIEITLKCDKCGKEEKTKRAEKLTFDQGQRILGGKWEVAQTDGKKVLLCKPCFKAWQQVLAAKKQEGADNFFPEG